MGSPLHQGSSARWTPLDAGFVDLACLELVPSDLFFLPNDGHDAYAVALDAQNENGTIGRERLHTLGDDNFVAHAETPA